MSAAVIIERRREIFHTGFLVADAPRNNKMIVRSKLIGPGAWNEIKRYYYFGILHKILLKRMMGSMPLQRGIKAAVRQHPVRMIFPLGFHAVSDALTPVTLAIPVDPLPGNQAFSIKPPHGAKRVPLALAACHLLILLGLGFRFGFGF